MRSMLLYLALVGLPLLALLGILEAGERIVPPHSIGGEWKLDEVLLGQSGGCPGLDFGGGAAEMRISQSGTRTEVELRDRAGTVLSASLRGDSLHGVGRVPEGACAPGGLVLRARRLVDERGEQLIGTLLWDACGECSPIEFAATRQIANADR